jgi:hypothetical protein
VEAFHPLIGLEYTGQSIVENLIPGAFGFSGLTCPPGLAPAGLILLVIGGLGWWGWGRLSAAQWRILLLGLALIFVSYWLVYSARADWIRGGIHMNTHTWSRYHLLPQLGLTLLVCGGLARREAYCLGLDPAGGLTVRQCAAVSLLIAGLFLSQFYWGDSQPYYDPKQLEVLRRIEAVDARCREYHISAATARAALAQLHVPRCGDRQNGWDMLRGSDDPQPMDVKEARRLLADSGE